MSIITTSHSFKPSKGDKVDLTTLSELGLRRLDLTDITISESCSKSPTVLISENGELITILKYKELKAVIEFLQSVLDL